MTEYKKQNIKCPGCGAVIDHIESGTGTKKTITCSYCKTRLKITPESDINQKPGSTAVTVEDVQWVVTPHKNNLIKNIFFICAAVLASGLLILIVNKPDSENIIINNKFVPIKEKKAAAAPVNKMPLRCDGNKSLSLKNKNLSSKDITITAKDNCYLIIDGCTLNAQYIALRTRGNAEVIVKNSKIEGKYRAVVASGNSRIHFYKTTCVSPEKAIVVKGKSSIYLDHSHVKARRFSVITKQSGFMKNNKSQLEGRVLKK